MRKKFQGVLLVSDMDGTILADDKQVPEKNVDAIKYFIDNGGNFTIASGRSSNSVSKYLDRIPFNAPIIGYNGAVIYDFEKETALWSQQLNPEAARTIIRDVLISYPDTGIEIYNVETINIIAHNPWTDKHMKRENLIFSTNAINHIKLPWYKVLFVNENKFLVQVEEMIKQRKYAEKFGDIRFVYSEDWFYEMLNKDTSKGHALERLANMLNVDMKNTYAIGDNFNDEEMLRTAAVGFCPSNAENYIKSLCDIEVSSNNQSAVADAIEYIDKRY